MSKYEIKNTEGKKVGDADLSADVYGIEPNIPVVHQVVTCQAASLRQGTHSTKNRHEVSGGGVKPYRQKGTGRALAAASFLDLRRAPTHVALTARWLSLP